MGTSDRIGALGSPLSSFAPAAAQALAFSHWLRLMRALPGGIFGCSICPIRRIIRPPSGSSLST